MFIRLTRVLTITSLTAFTTTATVIQPSYAEGTTFYCAKSRGVPVTYAHTQDGKKVPVIRWSSNGYFPPPWTAQQRCQAVSRRFQKNYDNGTLKVINIGTLNGESVVCAGISENSICENSNLLFTLKRGANARAIVQKLFDRHGLASGMILSESAGNSITIDFNTYLNNVSGESNQ